MVFDLGFLIGLAMIAAGLGLRVLSVFRQTPDNPSDAFALAIPLGLGGLGLATLGLGEVGQLNLRGIAALLAVSALIGLPALLPFVRRSIEVIRTGSVSWIWDGCLAIELLGTLLTALAPVTDGDALCYHLQVPKTFLASGSVGFDPDLHETIYPLLTEMLYAIALAVRGPVACRLVQWLLGVAFALNVAALARPVLGPRARWAGTVALLVPAVSNGMGAPLNDVALAAFGNAALFAWTRWHDRPCRRAAVLAGVLAGLALGVKYPALVLAGLIALAMLFEALRSWRAVRSANVASNQAWSFRHIDDRHYIDPRDVIAFERRFAGSPRLPRRRHWSSHAILFGLAALVVGSAWYLRAYHFTGNPVFPFFREIFGGAGLDEVLDPIKRPMRVTLWNILTALGPMTLDPARFDSVSHQFGPLFLLMLPPLFWERPPRRVWGIVGIGYLFLTLCLTQRQSMRFLLIAVGPMAVGVAWLASRWWDRPGFAAKGLVVLLVACLGFEAVIAAGRARHGLGVVFGCESAASYLARREPTYRVGRWIDANLPADARLIGQDHRGYYIPRPYAMELAHRRRTGLGTHGETPREITETLRRDGFTHLLLCPPEPEDAVEFDPTLSRQLAPWLDRQRPLYLQNLPDADGVVRRYAIYKLESVGPSARTSARLSR
jgi:hypothetical protein